MLDSFLSWISSMWGTVKYVGSILILIVIYGAIRNWLENFLYYMQDYTTGFFKVRDRLAASTGASIEELSHLPFDEQYINYGLDIGSVDGNIYQDKMRIPGTLRSTHIYMVGASGAGKSSLLKNMLIQDIQNGMGLCVIDPHGDLVNGLIPFLDDRIEHTVLLDLEDTNHMLAYNPLERREGVLVAEQVAKLILSFKRIWADSWGARMEDIIRHTLALLIEQGYTLNEFEKVLTDSDFRSLLVSKSGIDQTIDFFLGRFNAWSSKERALFVESSLNKVSAFMADRRIGARLSQTQSAFVIKDIMDSGGILLVNLAKGRLAGNADLFGSLLMADIEMSFLTRKVNERRPFALYVDEFQNIATESFDTVLAEARKYGLCLTVAHQSLKQLDDKLISLILGNAQTQIYFRIGRQDAERLAKEAENIAHKLQMKEERLLQEPENKFSLSEMWEIAFHNLARLEFRKAYVMIKGVLEHPELIKTLDTPFAKSKKFEYSTKYVSMETLEKICKARNMETEKLINKMLNQSMPVKKDDVPSPENLDFLSEGA